ncbi:MAG: hypothetical protein HY537_02895 [Deltaproteobacteria bacterium]|nr:hypothetical protein [Deltaproteobacteria bacterium]
MKSIILIVPALVFVIFSSDLTAQCESERAALVACESSSPPEVPCYAKPGRTECDTNWQVQYDFNPVSDCHCGTASIPCIVTWWYTPYRYCRSFDGCGNLTGQYTENGPRNWQNLNCLNQ